MEEPKPVTFKSKTAWRKWLQKNHATEDHVWLVHLKKHVKKPGLRHDEAIEEALCFGWIDGKLISIDDETFMLRYSPRRKNSLWSKINRTKAEELIRQEKMTEAGFAKIQEAKENGKWDAAYSSKASPVLPDDLQAALKKNKKAWENFQNFANSYRNMYIGWVDDARREPTRNKRIAEVVRRSAQNVKPGI